MKLPRRESRLSQSLPNTVVVKMETFAVGILITICGKDEINVTLWAEEYRSLPTKCVFLYWNY